MQNKEMILLGQYYGYQLYRNSDGFIEGYKSVGLVEIVGVYCRPAKDLIRIVTNVTEITDFPQFIEKHKPKVQKYNPNKDEKQIKLDIL